MLVFYFQETLLGAWKRYLLRIKNIRKKIFLPCISRSAGAGRRVGRQKSINDVSVSASTKKGTKLPLLKMT